MIVVCLNLLKKYNKSFDPLAGVSPSASVKNTRLSATTHVLSAPPTPSMTGAALVVNVSSA